jgi:iron complex transport system substrate-binding protein
MKKLLAILLSLALLLALAACGESAPKPTDGPAPAPTEAPQPTQAPTEAPAPTEEPAPAPAEYGTVEIQNGDRTVVFTEMPTGVLCANLYAAENMVMLGLKDYIVGKNVHTNPADVPLPELEEFFVDIPEIATSNENAVASGCDLVIGQISSFKDTSWGTMDQLEAEGINCLVITGTIVADETVEDIYTDIRNLGKIFKVEDKAEELIRQMKEEIAETQAIVAGVKEEDKPRVFVFDMYKEDQIYTTAAGLESNLIELAGGINTTRRMADSRWFMASVEVLVSANPDIIIINDYGKQSVEEKIAYIKGNDACSDIPAVVNDNFLIIPLVAVMQDIRASRACRTMAEYFYPDLF